MADRLNMSQIVNEHELQKCYKLQRLLDIVKDIDEGQLKTLCTAYKDKRVVVLPCKVGTPVWIAHQGCEFCRELYVQKPCLFGECEGKEIIASVFTLNKISDFGKAVFLDKAQAEAALEGK